MFARKDCLHTNKVGSMSSIAPCLHTIPLATPFQENASSILPQPLRNPAKSSSLETDTIEYLEPAMNYTSSDSAKTHANIIPFIDIKIGNIDQLNDTLKIDLKSSVLAPVLSSSHHGSTKDHILSSENYVWHHEIHVGSSILSQNQ